MRTLPLTLFFILFATVLFAQPDSLSLLHLNLERLEVTRIHAYILGGWALANIIIGGYLTYHFEDGEPESFHHMNAAWNMINLGVAWAMLHFANHTNPTGFDLASSVNYHYRAQKLMMLNTGLDVAYTIGGLLLYEHSKNNKKFDFVLRGFGKSLMFQGGFLLLLDATFYTIYSSSNIEWKDLIRHATSAPDGVGMIILF